MKVFITGGAGYIGSHLVDHLIKLNYSVTVFDKLSTIGASTMSPRVQFIFGDLRNPNSIQSAISRTSPNVVIHLASKKNATESIKIPNVYFENNVIGLKNLISAMKNCGIGKLIFSSSSAIYADSEKAPYSENSRTGPLNPYGESVLTCEQLLLAAEKDFGLKSYILRLFNVAGAAMDGSNGFRGNPNEPLWPIIESVARAAILKKSITLFKNSSTQSENTSIRDFIHVENVVEAFVETLSFFQNNGVERSEIVNCGRGIGTSVLEIVRLVNQVSQYDMQYHLATSTADNINVSIANMDKFNRIYPCLSSHFYDCTQICKSSFQWQQQILAIPPIRNLSI